jgi:CHASE3 domain sensor protein
MDTDRNLLFVVLTLQAGLIDPDRFVQACTLWTTRKDVPIGDLLVEQGWLTADARSLVSQLLALNLVQHGDDAAASLAAVAGAEARRTLASIGDADVERSLAALPSAPAARSGDHAAAEDFSTVPPSDNAGRNLLYEEIGHGGIGRVLRGRDPELRRDLAVKVLHDRYRGNVTVERRFVEEAQIGGQLQHPGIVPVHELGRFADGRPYFTMKLIKGRTLADLLNDRQGVFHEQGRFLGIFEQVCQTVAYAHSKGVIHRDLKPANVMVGAFGEVQVMDWGLAKVLAGGCDEAPGAPTAGTVIRTVRSDGSTPQDAPTGVIGTPAFIAPEQARGEAEAVDERADVFGLGAILCVILTGQPPYASADWAEVLLQAADGKLAKAFGRLDGCGADAEVVALCRACLAPEREDRPRNAGEVAARMAAYQATVQERLRKAELERTAAQARAEEAKATAAAREQSRQGTWLTFWICVASFILSGSLFAGSERQVENQGEVFGRAQRLWRIRLQQEIVRAQLAHGEAEALRFVITGGQSQLNGYKLVAHRVEEAVVELEKAPDDGSWRREISDGFVQAVAKERERIQQVVKLRNEGGYKAACDRLRESQRAREEHLSQVFIEPRSDWFAYDMIESESSMTRSMALQPPVLGILLVSSLLVVSGAALYRQERRWGRVMVLALLLAGVLIMFSLLGPNWTEAILSVVRHPY